MISLLNSVDDLISFFLSCNDMLEEVTRDYIPSVKSPPLARACCLLAWQPYSLLLNDSLWSGVEEFVSPPVTVCMYVCMYVCVFICQCGHVCVYVFFVCDYVYVCMYVLCVLLILHVHSLTYKHLHTHTHTHTHTHAHTHTHTIICNTNTHTLI